MREYKGYGGCRIVIDEDNIHIKQLLIKEVCTFGDIASLEFIEPKGLENGRIVITTKKHTNPAHSIFFLKKDTDNFKELYDYVASRSNLRTIEEQKQFEQEQARFEQEQIQRENDRIAKLDSEGVLYCPKCKSENVTVQIVQDGGVHKRTGLIEESLQIKLFSHKSGTTKFTNHKEAICQKCGNNWKI